MPHLDCQSLLIRDGNLIIRDGNLVLCEDQVTLASEIDTALAIQPLRTYDIGIAKEFDFAIPLGRQKRLIGDVIVVRTLTATVRK